MANLQTQVVDKDLHPHADQLVRAYVADFTDALYLQSRTLASIQEADIVLTTHVKDARDIIIRAQKRGWRREFLIIMGSALFGAFLQGFISELTAGRKTLVVVYMVMGIVGMLMVFIGLRK